MSKYRVILQPRADRDLEQAYQWIAERAPGNAARWYNHFVDAILSLSTNPERCGIASESEDFEVEIRQLLFGRRGGKYRALFTIRGSEVHVLHIRHAAQMPLSTDDLKEFL